MNTDGIIGGPELDRWITGNYGEDGNVGYCRCGCGRPIRNESDTCQARDEKADRDYDHWRDQENE